MQTNHKKNMLSTLTGKPVEYIPWAPRLDLWYRANKLAGTLPQKYQNASLIEIVDDFDWGFHAIVPNFRDLRNPNDDVHRALGIYNLWNMPYKTVFENIDWTARVEGDKTFVEYDTPTGKITTGFMYDESMRKAGISITHVFEHPIKSLKDYEALGYIFESAHVEPNYEGYREYADFVGRRGLAAAFVSLAGSPMHLIQRELMPLDKFFFDMHDHPEKLSILTEKIGLYWFRVLEIVVDCPAELVFVGANYDAAVTYPPFFHEHIEPWLRKYADELHARNKYLLTHTDGENTGLLQHYVDAKIDIADSICPKPMTKLTVKEVRDFFAGKIIIMGGIPSVALLPSVMPDKEFDAFLDAFFEGLGDGSKQILGISDTTPPAADWNRLVRIGERAKLLSVN